MTQRSIRAIIGGLAACLCLTGCTAGGGAVSSREGSSSGTAGSTTGSVAVSEPTVTDASEPAPDTTSVTSTYPQTEKPRVTKPTAPQTTTRRPTAATTTLASASTTAPQTTVPPRDRVGFGYYRMGDPKSGALEEMEKEAAKGHINTYQLSMAPYNFQDTLTQLEKVKELNGMAWLGIAETIFIFAQSDDPRYGYKVSQIAGWQDSLADMMDEIRSRDLMDSVLGFYFDEPLLCGVRRNDFRDVTGALRQTYPALRVMAVFAVSAITPEIWTTGHEPLDPDTARYLTDAGYDMYGAINEGSRATYLRVNADLKKRLGREDVRIWYVPAIMNYLGDKDQKYAIDHLCAMLEFLEGEKNPGGLLCYAYDISNHDGIGNIGYKEMRDREKNPWSTLEEWVIYTGKKVLAMQP